MTKLKVYDAKNETRLLGEIEAPEFHGDCLRVAALKGMSPYRIDPSALTYDRPFDIEDVELKVQWRTKTEAVSKWQRTRVEEAVLVTDAPLDLLTRVRNFRIAGLGNVLRTASHQRFY